MKDEPIAAEQETPPRNWALTLAPPILAPIAVTLLMHIPAYTKHPEDTIFYAAIILIVVGTPTTLASAALTIFTPVRETAPKSAALAAIAAAMTTTGVLILCRSIFL